LDTFFLSNLLAYGSTEKLNLTQQKQTTQEKPKQMYKNQT